MRKFLLLLITAVFTTAAAMAQVTTSSMTGIIRDSKETLAGATVTATHEPTGTVYAVNSNVDGRFNIPNMRIGGPYKVTVTFVGYQPATLEDIYIRLGEPFVINQVLSQTGISLAEVSVTGRKDAVMNSRRTGASTNISRAQLENLPTSNRSLNDFLRLTPQSNAGPSGGTAFGGSNNRYNNITIDGAVNNDVFGLANSGTPGGQAGTQPISLDAIQEVQVVLAPYDVTLGNFTGAGVNAVTRSGTNKVEGSVYYFLKNQDLSGKNVITGLKSANFSDLQYGIRVGGPIVKNKLFLFANVELGRRSAPLGFNAGEPGAITSETAKAIADYTLKTYKYDVGTYNSQNLDRQNDKYFVKLDWNINPKNQLTARYNYINAFDDNLTRNSNSFGFSNNAYRIKNTQSVAIVELRTNFNSKYSNNLIAGYTRIRDARTTRGALFPSVQINNIDGVSGRNAIFGSERSSVANQLDQDIYEITDNFKVNLGKHVLTFGTHNEFFKFRNLFINDAPGRWTFQNLDDYLNNRNAAVSATISKVANDPYPSAKFTAAQLSVYAQDEWDAAKGLKVTYGIRLDKPVFGDKPVPNATIASSFPGQRTDRTPSSAILFSPRIGFNYDVKGDRSIQVRGGTGIFTGRVPFVWLSNQYGNNGSFFRTINVSNNNPPTSGAVFVPDATNQASAAPAANTAEVNLVSDNFKIPQVWRSNLAADFKLPYGIIATVEGIYSKTLNNVTYKDINMGPSTGTLNPALSGGTTPGTGADNRPVYPNRINSSAFTNVILLENTNKGYTYTLTGQLQKTFDNGFTSMIAYTYGQARSVNDGTSSTAASNWQFVQIVNDPNNPPLAISTFQTKHRIVGSVGYQFTYGPNKGFGTGLAVFYSGYSGNPFTYVINGNLNGDSGFSNGNDLFYVPRTQSEIKFSNATTADAQWNALNAYISQDPYLSKRRGQYTERNGATTPWQHQFDVRITQDLGGMIGTSKNRLQLTLDVFNIGNLLNKEWGRQYSVGNQAYSIVGVTGPTSATGGYSFGAPAGNVPYSTSAFGSAWSMQFGARYLFN